MRTSPRPLGACTNSSPPSQMPTCDAPRETVWKNTRSPGSRLPRRTLRPTPYCSATVLGIAIACVGAGFDPGAVLAAAAMAASFMVGYTRAKSESLGFTPGTGMANIGLAPREVRLVLVTIGLLLTAIGGGIVTPINVAGLSDLRWWAGRPALAGTLAWVVSPPIH